MTVEEEVDQILAWHPSISKYVARNLRLFRRGR